MPVPLCSLRHRICRCAAPVTLADLAVANSPHAAARPAAVQRRGRSGSLNFTPGPLIGSAMLNLYSKAKRSKKIIVEDDAAISSDEDLSGPPSSRHKKPRACSAKSKKKNVPLKPSSSAITATDTAATDITVSNAILVHDACSKDDSDVEVEILKISANKPKSRSEDNSFQKIRDLIE